MADTVCFGSKI